MSAIKHAYYANVELNDGILRLRGPYPVGMADAGADSFTVRVTQGGAAFETEGYTVRAYFVRPDGKTVYLTGTAIGTDATVELTAQCYAVSGAYTLTVKLEASEDNITTLLQITGVVISTQTPDVADYGDEYPSLTALLAAVRGMVSEPTSEGPAATTASSLMIGGDTYALRTGTEGAAGYITFVTE